VTLSARRSRTQRVGSLFSPARSLPDIAARDEAKEVWPDARPQARKNRRRIRWNTLRIFSSRARRRWLRIVRRSRTVNVGQAPKAMKTPEPLGLLSLVQRMNNSGKCQHIGDTKVAGRRRRQHRCPVRSSGQIGRLIGLQQADKHLPDDTASHRS
jgi:hypothetical protein